MCTPSTNIPPGTQARQAPTQQEQLDCNPYQNQHGGDDVADSANANADATIVEPNAIFYEPAPHLVKFPTQGWKWTPTVALPRRDVDDFFHFDDFPDFSPNKTPKEILQEGCFGGGHRFWDFRSRKLSQVSDGSWTELPLDWTDGLDLGRKVAGQPPLGYDVQANKFKVGCEDMTDEWWAAGETQLARLTKLENETDAKTGWFQWYCRFYQGRRVQCDEMYTQKWRRRVGRYGIWRRLVLRSYRGDGTQEPSLACDPNLLQTCHHWAFEPRLEDLVQLRSDEAHDNKSDTAFV
jgi:hypothetical protein